MKKTIILTDENFDSFVEEIGDKYGDYTYNRVIVCTGSRKINGTNFSGFSANAFVECSKRSTAVDRFVKELVKNGFNVSVDEFENSYNDMPNSGTAVEVSEYDNNVWYINYMCYQETETETETTETETTETGTTETETTETETETTETEPYFSQVTEPTELFRIQGEEGDSLMIAVPGGYVNAFMNKHLTGLFIEHMEIEHMKIEQSLKMLATKYGVVTFFGHGITVGRLLVSTPFGNIYRLRNGGDN